MKTVTRVFWTLHTLNKDTDKYHKERKQSDFPVDVDLEACYAEIHDRFGMLGRDDRNCPIKGRIAPLKYAIITGHQTVQLQNAEEPQPRPKMIQDALLSPEQLFAAQSRKKPSTYVPRGRK